MENLNNVKVSVAMATYNGGQYLEQQFASLFCQTLKPDEIIVCDDCSTDDTCKILDNYAKMGLIKVFYNDKKLGVIENFKKAVLLCSNKNYIALADQDDVWACEKLSIQMEKLKTIDNGNSPALVYTDLRVMDSNMKLIGDSFMARLNVLPELESLNSLLFGNFINGCTMMFNPEMRNYFLQIPKEASMHDAWISLVAYSIGKNYYISSPLVNYRRHQNNTTQYKESNSVLYKKMIRNFKAIFKSNYLEDSINMAALFLERYRNQLSLSNVNDLQKFIVLKNKPFIYKKIKLVIARRYRYL